MTYCLGMRLGDSPVGIADSRITTGYEAITSCKVSVFHARRSAMSLMTSGLRSVRGKALTCFEEIVEEMEEPYDHPFKAVDVGRADPQGGQTGQKSLAESGLSSDIHSLVGGQMGKDKEPRLYLLYPQENWVEVGRGTFCSIVGATGYGKPVLDRP